ncbi:MAG: hypothetical protein H6R25_4064 [Proteobacteria bacterium]|nr:hypothetical protein [Pseudomonadota bacterium]
MKRSANIVIVFTLMALLILIVFFSGIYFLNHQNKDYPFRCSTFSRYDLSRSAAKNIEFAISHDLLINGAKIDNNTYRYKIGKIITSTTDNTPDEFFNLLLAEITLGPSYLQLDVDKVDEDSYLIGGPLSYLFICQRY